MKNILPILLFTSSTVNLFAAPLHNKTANTAKQQYTTAYQKILAAQSITNTARKTTGTLRRVIGNSYTANGTLRDSNQYYYSNDRGSVTTDPNSYFDNYFPGDMKQVQTIKCDSSVNWFLAGSTFTKGTTKSYIYDAGSKVSTYAYSSPWYIAKYDCTYNTANNITTLTSFDTFGSTALIAKSRTYYLYNSNGSRALDSSVVIATSANGSKSVYTYDANNNMITSELYYGIPVALRNRVTNTYDASNRLITTRSEYDNGFGILEDNNKDSFAYSASQVQPSFHLSSYYDQTLLAWMDYEILYNQYNAQGLIDTYYITRFTTQWDTVERDVYVYDANNLLLHNNGYMYLGNGRFSSTPYDQTVIYYEDFLPTSITGTSATVNNLVIYPNPANNSVTVHSSLMGTGNVTIYNSAGGLMASMKNAKTDRLTIDISTYPAGNYFLSITGDDHIKYKGAFSKL